VVAMIEIKQNIKFNLLHPLKNSTVGVIFYSETDMDDWLPYLNKFEDYLIQEKLKAMKKKPVAVV
jgi:hypothetical protein